MSAAHRPSTSPPGIVDRSITTLIWVVVLLGDGHQPLVVDRQAVDSVEDVVGVPDGRPGQGLAGTEIELEALDRLTASITIAAPGTALH